MNASSDDMNAMSTAPTEEEATPATTTEAATATTTTTTTTTTTAEATTTEAPPEAPPEAPVTTATTAPPEAIKDATTTEAAPAPEATTANEEEKEKDTKVAKGIDAKSTATVTRKEDDPSLPVPDNHSNDHSNNHNHNNEEEKEEEEEEEEKNIIDTNKNCDSCYNYVKQLPKIYHQLGTLCEESILFRQQQQQQNNNNVDIDNNNVIDDCHDNINLSSSVDWTFVQQHADDQLKALLSTIVTNPCDNNENNNNNNNNNNSKQDHDYRFVPLEYQTIYTSFRKDYRNFRLQMKTKQQQQQQQQRRRRHHFLHHNNSHLNPNWDDQHNKVTSVEVTTKSNTNTNTETSTINARLLTNHVLKNLARVWVTAGNQNSEQKAGTGKDADVDVDADVDWAYIRQHAPKQLRATIQRLLQSQNGDDAVAPAQNISLHEMLPTSKRDRFQEFVNQEIETRHQQDNRTRTPRGSKRRHSEL